MPNWCSNTLVLSHEDPEMIRRAKAAFERGELLNEFIPVPKDLVETMSGSYGDSEKQELLEVQQGLNIKNHGYKDWYDFCVNEWGTKWDVQGQVTSWTDTDVSMWFDSAWAPPIAAFEKLQAQGFNVVAYYYEPGMAFAGMFDEFGDQMYELNGMSSSDVRDNIPQELDAVFNIVETMEEYERENEDEVTQWYKEGVEETGLTPHKVKPQ